MPSLNTEVELAYSKILQECGFAPSGTRTEWLQEKILRELIRIRMELRELRLAERA